MTDELGTATDNGVQEQMAEESPQADPANSAPSGQDRRSVPYSRFQELNAQKKLAESALEAIVQEMVEDLPAALRDLVPAGLPPAERAVWIRQAKAKLKDVFSVPASSPDSKRPTGRPTQDISDMSAMQKIRGGYQK